MTSSLESFQKLSPFAENTLSPEVVPPDFRGTVLTQTLQILEAYHIPPPTILFNQENYLFAQDK